MIRVEFRKWCSAGCELRSTVTSKRGWKMLSICWKFCIVPWDRYTLYRRGIWMSQTTFSEKTRWLRTQLARVSHSASLRP